MSKSRHSKTKGAGLLCGMARCKAYKFSMAGATSAAQVENRQMRRLRKKK